MGNGRGTNLRTAQRPEFDRFGGRALWRGQPETDPTFGFEL